MANTLEFNVEINTKGVASGLKPAQNALDALIAKANDAKKVIAELSFDKLGNLTVVKEAAKAMGEMVGALHKIGAIDDKKIAAAQQHLADLVGPAKDLSTASRGIGKFADSLRLLADTMGTLKPLNPEEVSAAIAGDKTRRSSKTKDGPLQTAITGLQKVAADKTLDGLAGVADNINAITTAINGLGGATRKLQDLARGLERLPNALNGFVTRGRGGVAPKDFSTQIIGLTKALAQMSSMITTTGKKAVLDPTMAASIYRLGEGLKTISRLKIDPSMAGNLQALGTSLRTFFSGFTPEEVEKLQGVSRALNSMTTGLSKIGNINGESTSAGITFALGAMQQVANAAGTLDLDSLKAMSSAFNSISNAMAKFSETIKSVNGVDVENGMGKVIGSLQALAEGLGEFEVLSAMTTAKSISSVMHQLNRIAEISGKGEDIGAGVRVAVDAMRELITAVASFPEADVTKVMVLANALDQVRRSGLKSAEAMRRLTGETKKTASAAAHAHGPFSKLVAQFGRVIRYRLIRSVIMSIWRAMKEGVTNLYLYSEAIGNIDTNHAKSALDQLSTSALLIKNSLGAALTPVLDAIVPVVEAVASAFQRASNAIAAFFSALSGKSTFTGAIELEKRFAKEANSGGKALERQLLAFDEINRLDDNKGGGSSKEKLDYSKMFDEFEVPEGVKKFADSVKEIGEALSPVITEVKDLGVELGKWFVNEGMPQIATDLKVIVDNVIFKKGNATRAEVEQSIRDVLAMIAGAIIGFHVLGLPGAVIGATLGLKLSMEVNESLFKKGTATLDGMKTSIRDVSAAISGATIGWLLAGGKGVVLGASLGVAVSLLVDRAVFAKGGAVSETLASTLPVIMNMITGASIGWKLGSAFGPTGALTGALLGATVGAAITLGVMSAVFKKGDGTTQEWINELKSSFEVAFFAITGGLIGGAFGPAGVIFGIIIGAIIDLAIQKVRMKTDTNTVFEDEIKLPDYKDKYDITLTPEELRKGGKNYGPGPFGFASGGFPDAGSAFIAGEAGPEFVGNIGGRTGVVNTTEMADAVAAGNAEVVGAIVAMANVITKAIENKDMDVVLDGESMAQTLYPYTQNITRRNGSSFVRNGGLA